MNDIFQILNDRNKRDVIVDDICFSVDFDKREEFRSVLNYVIDERLHIFNCYPFSQDAYGEEATYSDLVLPSIRRIWCLVYVKPPSLIKGKKLELFQLLFNIDDFIDYLYSIIPKNIGLLKDFDKLDRTIKTLELIVDQYVGGMVEKVKSADINEEIRDLRIKKLLK